MGLLHIRPDMLAFSGCSTPTSFSQMFVTDAASISCALNGLDVIPETEKNVCTLSSAQGCKYFNDPEWGRGTWPRPEPNRGMYDSRSRKRINFETLRRRNIQFGAAFDWNDDPSAMEWTLYICTRVLLLVLYAQYVVWSVALPLVTGKTSTYRMRVVEVLE
jgi:hypothetical protein